jgi:hypothetical protein
VFEKRVLRGTFGRKRDEFIGGASQLVLSAKSN